MSCMVFPYQNCIPHDEAAALLVTRWHLSQFTPLSRLCFLTSLLEGSRMVVAATIDRHKSAPASDAGAFEQHRPALLGLAYRLLGEVAAAEDAVQETWIRWHRTARTSIRAAAHR